MYQKQKSRGYTPQISRETAFILRRVAWAMGKPMTQTLNKAVFAFVARQNNGSICSACKDKRCSVCPLAGAQTVAAEFASEQYGG